MKKREMLSGKVRRDAILIEQSFPLARALLGLGLSIIRFSLLSHSTTIPQQAKLIEQNSMMVGWFNGWKTRTTMRTPSTLEAG